MFDQVGRCIETLKAAVAGFEPGRYDGDQAMRLVGLFAEVERNASYPAATSAAGSKSTTTRASPSSDPPTSTTATGSAPATTT